MQSQLELSTIIKGDSVCIFDTARSGTLWGNIVVDFLTLRCLTSQRYNKTIFLNFERNIHSLAMNFKNDMIKDKCLFITPNYFRPSDFLLDIYKKIEEIKNINQAICVIVCSLSEIIAMRGEKEALQFISNLNKCLFDKEKSSDNNSDSNKSCFIYVVHESLHPPYLVNRIQTMSSVVVKVLPNNGTISKEVIMEIQTIRKSQHTGKVTENIEMFGYKDASLFLLKACHEENTDVNDSSTDEDKSVKSINNQLLHSQLVNSIGKNERLITFDSVDPEFDEDSDPDADLDL